MSSRIAATNVLIMHNGIRIHPGNYELEIAAGLITIEAWRDPLDTMNVTQARERVRELDAWILGFNPSGSRALLEAYELERRELRARLTKRRIRRGVWR